MPRIATKPSGSPEDQQRRDHADQRHRHDDEHDEQTLKAPQLDHQEGEHDATASAARRRSPRPATSRSPRRCRRPRCGSPPAGRHSVRRSPARAWRSTASGSTPGATSACTVSVGTRSRRQTSGNSWSIVEGRELAERHGASVGQRHLDVAQRRERDALLVGRPRDDIDEIDVVAHLRDGRAGDHGVQHAAPAPASSGPAVAPVLVDIDPDLRAGSIQSKLTCRALGSAATVCGELARRCRGPVPCPGR